MNSDKWPLARLNEIANFDPVVAQTMADALRGISSRIDRDEEKLRALRKRLSPALGAALRRLRFRLSERRRSTRSVLRALRAVLTTANGLDRAQHAAAAKFLTSRRTWNPAELAWLDDEVRDLFDKIAHGFNQSALSPDVAAKLRVSPEKLLTELRDFEVARGRR